MDHFESQIPNRLAPDDVEGNLLGDLSPKRKMLPEFSDMRINAPDGYQESWSYFYHFQPDVTEQLPVEIMQRIFWHASCSSFNRPWGNFMSFPKQGISSSRGPRLLMRVCSRWRRIVLNTRYLFTQIVITNSPTVDIAKAVSVWLTRSGSLPLEVYIDIEPRLLVSAEKEPSFVEMLVHLRRHLSRIRVLKITLSTYLQVLFPPETVTECQKLVALEIVETHISVGSLKPSFDSMGRISALNLHIFNAYGNGTTS